MKKKLSSQIEKSKNGNESIMVLNEKMVFFDLYCFSKAHFGHF